MMTKYINQKTNFALIPCQRHPFGEGIPLELLESTITNHEKDTNSPRFFCLL